MDTAPPEEMIPGVDIRCGRARLTTDFLSHFYLESAMSLLKRNWLIAILALIFVAPALAEDTKKDAKPNDAVVPVPRDGGWMKRHESFNERVKKGNVDLLFIGERLTREQQHRVIVERARNLAKHGFVDPSNVDADDLHAEGRVQRSHVERHGGLPGECARP